MHKSIKYECNISFSDNSISFLSTKIFINNNEQIINIFYNPPNNSKQFLNVLDSYLNKINNKNSLIFGVMNNEH